MAKVEQGYLLIADIGGYTRYLTAVELEHAHDVLADLIGAIAATLGTTFLSATETVLDQIEVIVDRRRDGRVLKLWYEDFFLVDRVEQHTAVDALWSFVGVAPFASPNIDYYLDSANVQMASEHTYGALPNLRELNEALGNGRTGWITYA